MGGKVYAKDCPLRHCEAHAMLPSLLSPPQLRHCEECAQYVLLCPSLREKL